jgi:hypothetical protein
MTPVHKGKRQMSFSSFEKALNEYSFLFFFLETNWPQLHNPSCLSACGLQGLQTCITMPSLRNAFLLVVFRVQDLLGQTVDKTSFEQMTGCDGACLSSAYWGRIDRRIASGLALVYSETQSEKSPMQKGLAEWHNY